MALTLRRERNGELRPYWYAEVQVDGMRRVKNLGVRWHGTPPSSLRGEGDEKFERSRVKALAKLEEVQEETKAKGQARHLTERLITAKTGKPVEYVKLEDLATRWRGLTRERRTSDNWLAWCDSIFARFAEKVKVRYVHEVTSAMVAEFVAETRQKYARRTSRGAEQLLKSAFSRFLPIGMQNPFAEGIARKSEEDDGDMVHRRPFTADELAGLFGAARCDTFLYPLVVTAACTGMRRGDVCRLTWKAVDLRAGVVAVKTSKTGASVEIPIFKPLQDVLASALAERRDGTDYVFPAAAAMIEENPDGLTWRFKKLVASVVPDDEHDDAVDAAAEPEVRVRLKDVLGEVCKAVEGKLEGVRRERVLNSLRLYAAGKSVREIERMTGQVRSGVSGDLHGAEKISGKLFMAKHGGGGSTRLVARVTRAGKFDEKPKGRMRRASTLDWHALRVTWVTLALAAGVPMEVARLVTGHKTVEVVLRHYFKPGREHLRAVLGEKLPDVLTGGKEEPKQLATGGLTVEELAKRVADKTATAVDRKRLAELLTAPDCLGSRAATNA